MAKRCLMAGLVVLSAMAVGCMQRTITITSEPSGALVHLNDQEVGRTPVTVPFTFYGVYDVRVEAEGYEALWLEQKANAPLWDQPGPDLIAEMVPGSRVNLKWHYDLTPQTPAQREDLLERALEMRQQVEK